jgi:LysM repeat protein
MTTGRSDRRPLKIRRRGRHTAPNQVEKVALQAGKAAPAVAIAGALVAAPTASQALAASAKPVPATTPSHVTTAGHQRTAANAPGTAAHTATLDSVETHAVAVATTTSARHAATTQPATYHVRSGDTLSKLATEFFHNDDWQYLYHENDKTVSDPNLIYVGQSLLIPASAPAHYALSDYVPRHSKPAVVSDPVAQTASSTSSDAGGSSQASGGSTQASSRSANIGGTSAGTVVVQSAPQSQGQYSCSGLEQLWEQAGGNSADAFMAAEIAMAESGGNPNAISPTDDYGLWQINASNGSLATLNPSANARSAVILSDNGANWGPWTTYTSGAYSGRC